jgi:hypothetical protein
VLLPGADGPGGPELRTAPRLIVTPELVNSSDGPWVARQLRADLIRLARARSDGMGGALPGWLDLGTGDYTAYRGSGAKVAARAAASAYGLDGATLRALKAGTWSPRLELDPAVLTGPAALSSPGRSGTVAARDAAFLTCLYVADRFGDATLSRLVGRASDQGATRLAAAEEVALTAVLHTDRTRLAAAVAAWARTLTAGMAPARAPGRHPVLSPGVSQRRVVVTG